MEVLLRRRMNSGLLLCLRDKILLMLYFGWIGRVDDSFATQSSWKKVGVVTSSHRLLFSERVSELGLVWANIADPDAGWKSPVFIDICAVCNAASSA